MLRNVAVVSVAVALLVGLAGCSSTPNDQIRVSGRILLVHVLGDSDQTDFSGPLGENAAHCITVGNFVVIVPNAARLLDDGSVVMNGHTWKQGTRVAIGGGGSAETPKNSPCRAKKFGYWVSGPTWTAR